MQEAKKELQRTNTKQPRFAVMVKPAGSVCNMRCTYCYYLKTDIDVRTARMSYETLETMIKSYMETSDTPVFSFTWHGGEPAAAGLDFYREAVRLEKKYLPEGKECWNSLQTNGLLLDDEWCAFLAENHFDVGLSIDGTEEVHDHFRRDAAGQPTYERTRETLFRLKAHGLRPDLLCTVTNRTAEAAREVYRTLSAFDTGWMQFIPIRVRTEDGWTEDSVTPENYGRFLTEVFSEWFYHDMGKTEVQLFSETALVLSGGEANLCWMRERCGEVPVIERDGGVYSCDHFVRDEHRVGHVSDLKAAVLSEKQRAFGNIKKELHPDCTVCPYLMFCHNGCPKDRLDGGKYELCAGLKRYFSYAVPRLKEAMTLSARHVPPDVIMTELTRKERAEAKKIGRNAPCPCGSGLKYKNCCMRLVP